MANEGQLSILLQGPAAWNQWRTDNYAAKVDLVGAELKGANLYDAHLYGVDLSQADLTDALLHKANLTGANLNDALLIRTNLAHADLSGANLTGANLDGACLLRTYLFDTNVMDAYLGRTELREAIFAHCPTLHLARGLEEAGKRQNGHGSAVLDHRTLRACLRHLPDDFLKNIGYRQQEIAGLRALYP